MQSAVIVFPGSNRDHDITVALAEITGRAPHRVWHKQAELPDVDLVVIPGGFAFGDYLRAGAIAARSPVMEAVRRHAGRGALVLGICNGFQVLTEAGLLPGVLMRNASLRFVCREVKLEIASTATPFTAHYRSGEIVRCPVAHHDGNYFADSDTLRTLRDNDRIVFRYAEGTNPNGSRDNIAGICNRRRNVLGLMPHPEDLIAPAHGGTDGRRLFESMMAA